MNCPQTDMIRTYIIISGLLVEIEHTIRAMERGENNVTECVGILTSQMEAVMNEAIAVVGPEPSKSALGVLVDAVKQWWAPINIVDKFRRDHTNMISTLNRLHAKCRLTIEGC